MLKIVIGFLNHYFGFRYTINCPYCGEIYRSRQYWYGNKSPEDTVVRTEITHVWPGVSSFQFFFLICILKLGQIVWTIAFYLFLVLPYL